MRDYDVIVVGGGSSGMMAAINAAQQGVRVLVVDKNPRLGRKLVLSGGGRCNVTNRTTREDLIQHIPGNGKFLYGALNQFDQEDIIDFFESRGVELKEEDHGRMFPVTDRARTILDTLVAEMDKLGVDVRTRTVVDEVLYDTDTKRVTGLRIEGGEEITCGSIVLATGGRAYPRTGATGDGYGWARKAGHTIERLYPTEAPILSEDPFITNESLKGVSLRDVPVTVWNGDLGVAIKDGRAGDVKPVVVHRMDMIFTHFGLSGPAVLRCSGHVNQYLHETGAKQAYLSVDIVPDSSEAELREVAETMRDKHVINILKQWMPERMAESVVSRAGISPQAAYKQVDHADVDLLWALVKRFIVTAYGTQPIEKGFVTGGGVSTKEVNPKTMESKLMAGLFFCGELLDINGYTGGYNITAAFVTGTVSGQNAAWTSFE